MGKVRFTKKLRNFVPTLERNGYIYARSRGSHFVFINRKTGKHISVNKDLKEVVKERLVKENCLE